MQALAGKKRQLEKATGLHPDNKRPARATSKSPKPKVSTPKKGQYTPKQADPVAARALNDELQRYDVLA